MYKYRNMQQSFNKQILLIYIVICWTNTVKFYKMHGTYIKNILVINSQKLTTKINNDVSNQQDATNSFYWSF